MTRVSDLTGAELALWVARTLGWKQQILPITKSQAWFDDRGHFTECVSAFMPHEDWYQGGRIIDEQKISLEWDRAEGGWSAEHGTRQPQSKFGATTIGATALEAAMRCVVAHAYGEEVPS